MEARSAPQLRLRIFAGPNGSGKSTIIKKIRETKVKDDLKLDVGIYVNADDIVNELRNGKFNFTNYQVSTDSNGLLEFAETSGLLSRNFSRQQFQNSFILSGNKVKLIQSNNLDRVAQIIARYLRRLLIAAKKRFSFETVFSHKSNLDDMLMAKEAGYKIYLYFVSTESPEINKYRVALRVKQGGHNVAVDRIEKRYYKSLELLPIAAEMAYQAFFFDNSINNEPYRLVGHFKNIDGTKNWDEIPESEVSLWFRKYYLNKSHI